MAVRNITPELYLIKDRETYAIPEMLWERVGEHYWLRLIAVPYQADEEIDIDLDLPIKVWEDTKRIIEMYPRSQGITYILHYDTNKKGQPRRLELKRIIENPTIPNLQTEFKFFV